MEGIAGTYGTEDKALVGRMLRKLRHRGPDDRRVFAGDRCVLGARASLAPSGRSVRAIAEEDGIAVASDSYLFNKDVLRREFAPDAPDDLSDPELILGMYKKLGTQLFAYLDGGYAVAIADGRRFVVARDRYGMKPLYLSGGVRKGILSSEMKSQLVTGQEFVPFPTGKMLIKGRGLMPVRPRGAFLGTAPKGRSHAKTLRGALVRAAEGALESGRGFNVLLSGGIDSSAVAAAASQVTDEIDTVCVGHEGGEDVGMARKVAEILGTVHKERAYEVDEMLDMLDEVIYAAESFDMPLVRSCIPNYMATHAFDDRTRPTLCGEGGDEVFAGYDHMREIRDDGELRRERRELLRNGHTTGFKRVDRMTSSASLDGRMPIMSRTVVDFGLALNRRAIVGPKPNENKLVLRKAFADILPDEVVWRRKQRFSDGAGSITALADVTEKMVSDEEFERERRALPGNRIRTKEELIYYRAFRKHFDSESAVRAVGFTPRP